MSNFGLPKSVFPCLAFQKNVPKSLFKKPHFNTKNFIYTFLTTIVLNFLTLKFFTTIFLNFSRKSKFSKKKCLKILVFRNQKILCRLKKYKKKRVKYKKCVKNISVKKILCYKFFALKRQKNVLKFLLRILVSQNSRNIKSLS